MVSVEFRTKIKSIEKQPFVLNDFKSSIEDNMQEIYQDAENEIGEIDDMLIEHKKSLSKGNPVQYELQSNEYGKFYACCLASYYDEEPFSVTMEEGVNGGNFSLIFNIIS